MTTAHKACLLLKEYGATQSFKEMVGYVMKDNGKAHFQEMRHNVSDEEVEAGVYAYGLVRNMYAEGKREITKAGLYTGFDRGSPKVRGIPEVRQGQARAKPLPVPMKCAKS